MLPYGSPAATSCCLTLLIGINMCSTGYAYTFSGSARILGPLVGCTVRVLVAGMPMCLLDQPTALCATLTHGAVQNSERNVLN